MRALVLALLCFSLQVYEAEAGGPGCGCDQASCSPCSTNRPATTCCHRCRRSRCCCSEPAPVRTVRAFEPPVGPIVTDSIPVLRSSPAFVAMPFMPMMVSGQMRGISFEDTRDRSRGSERNCEGSQDRLDELDARVEALNLRMQTIQRAVEIQTRILEELKAEGKIGGKKVPSE